MIYIKFQDYQLLKKIQKLHLENKTELCGELLANFILIAVGSIPADVSTGVRESVVGCLLVGKMVDWTEFWLNSR
ncbi:hypothetical protein BpHYR1_011028 [Brachionus plicatilis]|uniref:Uncharacterized protein n=1 Tax=Brachionus plicatilis TaxID=10195 RepID=A0A3M7QC89_BRAPC|nr:hypothetical protein BpHYR1_011028 [Brachionus plicatilis]